MPGILKSLALCTFAAACYMSREKLHILAYGFLFKHVQVNFLIPIFKCNY